MNNTVHLVDLTNTGKRVIFSNPHGPPAPDPPLTMSKPDTTQKSVRVDRTNLERFEAMYPMYGAFSWFVDECLAQFVEATEIHPSDIVAEAVTAALSSD